MRKPAGRHPRVIANLPPLEEVLRGSVFVRILRCGKPTCRCAAGEGHRATYLSVTFPGGRTEQISLPPHLVPVARQWVANYFHWSKALEQASDANRQVLRTLREQGPPPRETGRRGRSGLSR
jgi:hypothetical protein